MRDWEIESKIREAREEAREALRAHVQEGRDRSSKRWTIGFYVYLGALVVLSIVLAHIKG
ncbi:MAG TPA: hypothetical protein VMT37_11450 [Solirubrobacterales bacterium]|nr:hypothetical protein [Solirubrobacterales bacterium]